MLTHVRRCLDLLPPRLRWQWAALIPLALVAAGLEAFGAIAVFALVALVGGATQTVSLPLLGPLARWSTGDRSTVLVAAGIVGLFYILKNVILTVAVTVQNRVIAESVVLVSRSLVKGYLSIPFVDHVRRNSAELIRNCIYSVHIAFREVMEPSFMAVTEAFITAAVVLVLMIKAPLLTLTASVVLSALLGIEVTLTRRALTRWGREEQSLRGHLLQMLQEVFHGLKDIKLRGREAYYYETFAGRQRAVARVQRLTALVLTLSRLFLETLFICGVLMIVVFTTLQASNGMEIVPLLGLYAYAGFRAIPSINRILTYVGRVQYGSASVDALYDDFRNFPFVRDLPAATHDGVLDFTDRLRLDDVSFAYNKDRVALQHITIVIRHGESIGIVGPTGAGKSTLIDVILGLLQPAHGTVSVDGIDVSTRLRAWQNKIGYVPQAVYLTDDTVRRNIAFGLPDDAIDDTRVRSALQMAQLDAVIAALPKGLDTMVGERGARLSGGERQRIAIARALYHEPELLVFDEATAALDNQTERDLTRAIESLRGKKTLLVIAHRLTTVRSCDRLIFLRDGRIEAVGSFDELLADSAPFRQLAHVDA